MKIRPVVIQNENTPRAERRYGRDKFKIRPVVIKYENTPRGPYDSTLERRYGRAKVMTNEKYAPWSENMKIRPAAHMTAHSNAGTGVQGK